MPSIPSDSAFKTGLSFHNAAVNAMGKGFLSGTIKFEGRSYPAAIWALDGKLPSVVTGGLDLGERLQFSIEKRDLPNVFEEGATVIYVQMKRAYVIDRINNETADATSWHFEARRAPGGDPA